MSFVCFLIGHGMCGAFFTFIKCVCMCVCVGLRIVPVAYSRSRWYANFSNCS